MKLAQRYVQRALTLPLDIRAGKIEGFEIVERPALTAPKQVDIVDIREALLTGQAPAGVELPIGYRRYELLGDGRRLMSNDPREMIQMEALATAARGNVLIGGLGLGILLGKVLKRGAVSGVTVIEREQAVIELASPPGSYLRKLRESGRVTVIRRNLFEYLAQSRDDLPRFDTALFDIWYGQSEAMFGEFVLPLRRLAARAGLQPKQVHCWMEEQMRGQLRRSLVGKAIMDAPPVGDPYRCIEEPFLRVHGELIRAMAASLELPPQITLGEHRNFYAFEMLPRTHTVQRIMRRYLEEIGSERWEQTYGALCDEAMKMKKKE